MRRGLLLSLIVLAGCGDRSVAQTPRDARKVRDRARRNGLSARVVERVWFSPGEEWAPEHPAP